VEPGFEYASRRFVAGLALATVAAVFFGFCVWFARVDPAALVTGLPRLAEWAEKSWPPLTTELDVYTLRALETVAIATVGTFVASLFAIPLAVLIARNTTPSAAIAYPIRWVVNGFRGIDTMVFALLFVAAVGLGPFAGVLGMIVHSLGVIAKLNAEAIETLPHPPLEAAAMSGASQAKIVSFAVIPTAMPQLASVSLYVWEANIRTSTILGIVGAGGIGTEIKAAIDLFDFQKLLTLSLIVLVMVTIVDQISATVRRRLS
jgi:phosphonate transport system permease protein